jgi:hypothetical protein
MSDKVIRSLAAEIRHSHFFALLADETTDASNRQQLVVCIRWIDDGLQAHEDFIGLYKIDNTKASTPAESIKDVVPFLIIIFIIIIFLFLLFLLLSFCGP